MGIDPNSGLSSGQGTALWPGAMGMLAGFDLLAKFFAGSDDVGKVGARFTAFVREFAVTDPSDADVVYQLRNALLHSFGLYSRSKNRIYRFTLTNKVGTALVLHTPPDEYRVDLSTLHRAFEKAIAAYCLRLDGDADLQSKFRAMYASYGRVHIG